ncbi:MULTISPECIES: cache domain-containing protein [unclassified Salipiger]|uniref:cache domain-containing protein n=1 Tax=unclassified Salipiger TaxID=2640570 RepID=UPI0013BCBE02|nr:MULTISPECIES: cache domain-containing protein [unclassified Salipiger]NDV51850.1 histidine kinase [Salipiger sp. PrR003]NDW31023.1 histidine kinase [Salipiger sp. PrR007]
MRAIIQNLRQSFRLSYGQKLFLLASVPLILACAAIALLVAFQSRTLAEREIRQLENELLEAKKQELRNYVTQARNGFYFIYGAAAPDDDEAKTQVAQILAAMIYGEDGSFFVYDYDGTNLVSPRRTDMIGRNWSGLTDSAGTPIVDPMIKIARQGSGYLSFLWPKPSTGEEAEMIAFVLGFQDWQWAVGTGVWIDDVLATVSASRAEVQARIRRTFLYIGGITLGALLVVFFSGLAMNLRERRLADAKLKELTQRVFDAQEDERRRVARELHDGISQILVGVKYALDITKRRLAQEDPRAMDTLERGHEALTGAIQEVRRISRDLRPGVLDDLGLGPALKALIDDFEARTGIKTTLETVVFRNRVDQEGRIALYRIAQEALTNIERHSGATEVTLDLRGHRRGATLRIEDNGHGIDPDKVRGQRGIGLRNMQERMDQLGGHLRILSSRSGTVIEAQIPLSHLLPPEDGASTSRPKASA